MSNISIAPMMGYTDKHFRVLARFLSADILLYTQMIVADALAYNSSVASAFGSDNRLGNVVLQLGGSNIKSLIVAGKIAKSFGYKEINLNIGCPSSKVKLGGIGVCLLKTPEVVAECVDALTQIGGLRVTVKTRIGVDDIGGFDYLCDFVRKVRTAGCAGVVFHARKAWLNGLSPKDNRNVPPLDYDMVKDLRSEFADYYIGINGGIVDYLQGMDFVGDFSEVMLGRHGYKNLQLVLKLVNQNEKHISMSGFLEKYLSYALSFNCSINNVLRHCMGLYYAGHYSGRWRRAVSLAMQDSSEVNLNKMVDIAVEIDRFYQSQV
jgi:tRNA-dihydrouridine synthase A